jgi:hypothetical protein
LEVVALVNLFGAALTTTILPQVLEVQLVLEVFYQQQVALEALVVVLLVLAVAVEQEVALQILQPM